MSKFIILPYTENEVQKEDFINTEYIRTVDVNHQTRTIKIKYMDGYSNTYKDLDASDIYDFLIKLP